MRRCCWSTTATPADDAILAFVKGPDFPTGGLVVDPPAVIRESYITGRGGFRTRARWSIEREKGGGWTAVVTEIPYGVQKGKLIEQIANLINDKKLPILADVRDESDELIRLVLEPRSRTVDAGIMMDGLFRLTDLETRIPLNLNVLDKDRTPRVMSLAQALGAWVDHQFVVLVQADRAPAGEDRGPDRTARRLSDRVSEPRPDHRDHPDRGRAQAGDDRGIQR